MTLAEATEAVDNQEEACRTEVAQEAKAVVGAHSVVARADKPEAAPLLACTLGVELSREVASSSTAVALESLDKAIDNLRSGEEAPCPTHLVVGSETSTQEGASDLAHGGLYDCSVLHTFARSSGLTQADSACRRE